MSKQMVSMTTSRNLEFTTSAGEAQSRPADNVVRCLKCNALALGDSEGACDDPPGCATPCGPFAIYEYSHAEDLNGAVLHDLEQRP